MIILVGYEPPIDADVAPDSQTYAERSSWTKRALDFILLMECFELISGD